MAPYYDGLAAFLFRQLFWAIPDPPPVRLDGQRVLVTGGNSGVGYYLTSMLVSRGAEVVMAVRSITKGREARDTIINDVPGAQISVRNCDLGCFESMRTFIAELHRDGLTFDIVVFNAGVWCAEWIASADGLDMTLQVNVLANAFLATSLQPLLRSGIGRPARMVFVTSEGHAMIPTNFRRDERMLAQFDSQSPQGVFNHYTHYYSSKLFGLLWAMAFARRVDPENVSIVLASPGLCKSNLFRHVQSGPTNVLTWCFARSCLDGARMILTAVLEERDCRSSRPEDTYYSQGGIAP
ncbi:unnamed protein product [Penicillium crustosum]